MASVERGTILSKMNSTFETNDLLCIIGHYRRPRKILQINNTKVRDS